MFLFTKKGVPWFGRDDGGWPPSATRIGDNFNKRVDTEDLATAFIRFDNGSTLLLEAG